jgi:hypothetical protein
MNNRMAIAAAVLGSGLLTHLPSSQAQDATSIFQVVPTPNPQGYASNNLFAVGASSSTDIWAVGLTAIHYDGTAWTGFPLPGIEGAMGHQMEAVAVLSPTNAWAVGSYLSSPTTNGDILHWDGTQWSGFPNPANPSYYMVSMAAVSADDIWAGGCIPEGFEHFDGTQWTWVPSAGSGGVEGESCVQGISALATNDVWAVGWSQSGTDIDSTEIQHWDGTQWTLTPSPNQGTGSNQLYGVVALSDNDVWAVGSWIPKPDTGIEYPNKNLIEHWDGSAWTVVPSPNLAYGGYDRDNVLQGIVAVSPNDLWAFGWVDSNPGPVSPDLLITLVLHWDGTSWTIAPSPNPAHDPSLVVNQLYGGVVTGPGDVWLVGFQELAPGRGEGTLVLNTTEGKPESPRP